MLWNVFVGIQFALVHSESFLTQNLYRWLDHSWVCRHSSFLSLSEFSKFWISTSSFIILVPWDFFFFHCTNSLVDIFYVDVSMWKSFLWSDLVSLGKKSYNLLLCSCRNPGSRMEEGAKDLRIQYIHHDPRSILSSLYLILPPLCQLSQVLGIFIPLPHNFSS